MFFRGLLFASFLVAIGGHPAATAQQRAPSQQPSVETRQVVGDSLGRSTPRGSVVNFIRACEREDFALAADFLDSNRSSEHKQELAQELFRVMNLSLKTNLDALSRTPEGALGDGLPLNRDLVGTARTGNYTLDIYVDRVSRGQEQLVWLFAGETLRNLPEFYEMLEAPWVERHVPKFLTENTLFGISLFRWFQVPFLLALVALISWWAARILTWAFHLTFHNAVRKRFALDTVTFIGPLRLLIFVALLSVTGRTGVTLVARQVWTRVSVILIAIAVAWILMRIIDLIAANVQAKLIRNEKRHRLAAVELFRGIAKILAFIIGVLIVLRTQGVELATALAGLGIGGVAIAFAAQKTIENLFGTVMLIADESIRVGEFCRIGDTLGTVEKIGMRSTRIRTLDRTVVSLPNGQVASMKLENYAARDKFWFTHTIGVRLETSADQLRYLLVNIRSLLQEHPKVESDSARIRLTRLGGAEGSCLNLEIFAYVSALEFPAYLEIQEDLLLRIMDIVEESGTRIVSSAYTAYFTADSGLDPKRSAAAAEKVQEWRDQGKLPFPQYSARK